MTEYESVAPQVRTEPIRQVWKMPDYLQVLDDFKKCGPEEESFFLQQWYPTKELQDSLRDDDTIAL